MRTFTLALGMMASGLPAQVPMGLDRDELIVVTGRNGTVTRRYLDQVARPEAGRQLARWNEPLCIRYDGVDRKFADFIQARVATIASKISVKLAKPGCSAGALVLLTDHADAVTKVMLNRTPPLVGSQSSANLLTRRAKNAIAAPQTVRWLTGSATVSSDGRPINGRENMIWSASLIASPTREDIRSKIIVIDALRLADVKLSQLADYVAFVALASPDVTADFSGTDSIMALFAGTGTQSARMTRQDLAFLEALYRAPSDRSTSAQRRAIHARLARDAQEERAQAIILPGQ